MKKSIFIWMTSMHLGGAEKSLIGLLQSLDYEKVSVDLFLNRHEGELLSDIPADVNILPQNERYACLAEPLANTIKKKHLLIAASRVFARFATTVATKGIGASGVSVDYSNKFTKWLMPQICKGKVYDLAISFITPHYFVTEKVNAKKKLAWIHTDYTNITVDVASQRKMWAPYDKIVSISQSVTQSFLSIFPEFEDKLVLIENILPKSSVVCASEAFDASCELDGRCKTLLSVGRFSYAKNFDNIPEICNKILSLGINVKWYIIGYGSEEKRIREKIKEFGVTENVIILGKKSNPYPYIAACDMYVQPSRYEGKAVTVREAQMLCKPVVITDFETAKSQLDDGVDGVIVPMDNSLCARAIADILLSEEKMNELSENCRTRDYSGIEEINKIYDILEI